MIGTTLLALSALCAINLLALTTALVAGRRPDRRREVAGGPAVGAEPAAARRTGRHSVDDLVDEAEEAERLAARGESRLAADLARWRRRAEGGKAAPAPAMDRRPAVGWPAR